MDLLYHAQMVESVLANHFSAHALQEVIAANWSQDDMPGLLLYPARHFDNNLIAEALAYMDEEYAAMAQAARLPDGGPTMRAAFGRLTHTAQDFYAHSSYVDLWLARHGGLDATHPEQIDGVDPDLLASPDLRTWEFYLWRDLIYYVPGLKHLARRIYIPPYSHEARHLDDPGRGPKFVYAIKAAEDRTRQEYERAVEVIGQAGGPEALARFHGTAG